MKRVIVRDVVSGEITNQPRFETAEDAQVWIDKHTAKANSGRGWGRYSNARRVEKDSFNYHPSLVLSEEEETIDGVTTTYVNLKADYELEMIDFDYDHTVYRKREYPSLEERMEALYDALESLHDNGAQIGGKATAMLNEVKRVRAKYPGS